MCCFTQLYSGSSRAHNYLVNEVKMLVEGEVYLLKAERLFLYTL